MHTEETKEKIRQSCRKKTQELWDSGKLSRTMKKRGPLKQSTKEAMSRTAKRKRIQKLPSLLVDGCQIQGSYLKNILIEAGLKKDECEVCGQLPEWNGNPLTLELDHVDGNRYNNQLNNLRVICPHCHSQTDTYRWKNSKTKKPYTCSIRTVPIA